MTAKIPATVSVLTHNSGSTLARALQSARAFDDIVVADGRSTDATLQIARAAGARVIAQDPNALYANGRMKDWSIVRNQCLREGKYDWHFYLDSDEYLDDALMNEIRAIVEKNDPAAYWVPRKYVLDGVVIERSISYPNQQMRFFHRSTVSGFRKPIHERVIANDGFPVRKLQHPMFVPIENDHAATRAKTIEYMNKELARQAPLTSQAKRAMLLGAVKAIVRSGLRLVRVAFQTGPRMPLSRDLLAPWYEIEIARRAYSS